MHIKTRNNLIEFLENNLPPNSVHLRALLNHNENLGGFSRIGSSNSPGWIVRVKSKYGNIYYVVVIDQKFNYTAGCIAKTVPWRFWVGDQSKNPLYCGDKPEEYKMLRSKELEHDKT